MITTRVKVGFYQFLIDKKQLGFSKAFSLWCNKIKSVNSKTRKGTSFLNVHKIGEYSNNAIGFYANLILSALCASFIADIILNWLGIHYGDKNHWLIYTTITTMCLIIYLLQYFVRLKLMYYQFKKIFPYFDYEDFCIFINNVKEGSFRDENYQIKSMHSTEIHEWMIRLIDENNDETNFRMYCNKDLKKFKYQIKLLNLENYKEDIYNLTTMSLTADIRNSKDLNEALKNFEKITRYSISKEINGIKNYQQQELKKLKDMLHQKSERKIYKM